MPDPLHNRIVVLGVTGSIACHKAVDLASKLTQEEALVDVIMTGEASNFVTPLAFRSITHRRVVTNLFDPQSELSIDHVALAETADVVVVAPTTANTIAKIALGLADDALTTTVLATQAPVLLCPAMDGHMYENPATQENIRKLRDRGYAVAGPARGHLASGLSGTGRLLETPEILGHIRRALGSNGDLAGRKVVVSAGGTQESIDPVRVITNRSSGKQGYAIAEAARDRGAAVVLVAAPTALKDPPAMDVVRVETVEQMRAAVLSASADADALIMAAAISDYRPAETAEHKIKKGESSDGLTLRLVVNRDFLPEIPENVVKVGFAAESRDLIENARQKLLGKGLAIVAANDITDEEGGFGSDDNRVVLLDRSGGTEKLDLMSKYEVGHRILDRVVSVIEERNEQ